MIDPPYIVNLYQAQTIMYPVLKGTAGFGGEVSAKDPKHLLLEFNCLGIKGTEDVLLVIPSHNPNHKEIAIPFRK